MRTDSFVARTHRDEAAAYVEIHGGHVRLYGDGRVRHYLTEIDGWACGFGPWGGVAAQGLDKHRLDEWLRHRAQPV